MGYAISQLSTVNGRELTLEFIKAMKNTLEIAIGRFHQI